MLKVLKGKMFRITFVEKNQFQNTARGLKTKINLIAEHNKVFSFKMLMRPVAERISLLLKYESESQILNQGSKSQKIPTTESQLNSKRYHFKMAGSAK